MPGVSCLLAGAWPVFAADGADTAGCANVLSSTEPTLPSRGSRTHTIFVQVSAVARPPGRRCAGAKAASPRLET